MLRISTLLILVGAASAFFTATPAGVTRRHIMQRFANAYSEEQKAQVVEALLKAKKESGLTFDDIAEKTGLTNAYVAQLFYRQAHLKDETAKKIAEIMPLSPELIEAMKEMPFRTYERDVIRTEPLIYRLEEAVLHYGQGIKAIVNEKFGDGIMSAIDVKIKVDKVKGKMGEDRVVITMNGKYLPHIEHIDE